ncbi:hypothetical protein [Pinirhizobacter sp.]|jgi:hypothetical protein|uniref:hypothetical protein n=1 Tax=Pinirhizobacter sp. TaxID=2950432 RepID=UPI002F3FF5FC
MDITIDTSQLTALVDLWNQSPEIAGQEMFRAATEIDLLIQGELMQVMPRGAGGLHGAGLTGAVFHQEQLLTDGVTGMVATSQPYAEYVEVGTKPHAPPIQPLKDWVEAKLGIRGEEAMGVAFAISRTIAKRGTRAQPVWQQTYQRLIPTIQAKLDEGLARIQARLVGGAA